MTDREKLIVRLKKALRGEHYAKIPIADYFAAIQALSDQGPRKATLPESSADYQQQRGVAWDIIDQALNTYDGWMLDDDYQAGRVLREIMDKMRDRRNAFLTTDKADAVSSVEPVKAASDTAEDRKAFDAWKEGLPGAWGKTPATPAYTEWHLREAFNGGVAWGRPICARDGFICSSIDFAIQALSDQGPRLPEGYEIGATCGGAFGIRRGSQVIFEADNDHKRRFLSAFLTTDKADAVSSVEPVNWPGKLRDWVDEHPEHLVTRSELEVWLNRYISSATKQGDSNG